jgi:hypothetical protein
MGCVVSSPVSTNPSVFKSFVFLNHSPWLFMWFEARGSEGRVGSPGIRLGRGTSLASVNLHPKTNHTRLV